MCTLGLDRLVCVYTRVGPDTVCVYTRVRPVLFVYTRVGPDSVCVYTRVMLDTVCVH